jgi:hypothetical protein
MADLPGRICAAKEGGLAGTESPRPRPVVLEEKNLTPTEPSLSRLIDICRSKLGQSSYGSLQVMSSLLLALNGKQGETDSLNTKTRFFSWFLKKMDSPPLLTVASLP